MKKLRSKKIIIARIIKSLFWLMTGAGLALFLLVSFTYIIFERINQKLVYPGIMTEGIDLGRKTEKEVYEIFAKKNEDIANIQFIFSNEADEVTTSAKQLDFGYDQNLISKQAMVLGRSGGFLSNISIILQAYVNGLAIKPAYHYSDDNLQKTLAPLAKKMNKDAIDALFKFENGKVAIFQPSKEGQAIDVEKIKINLNSQFQKIRLKQKPQKIIIPVDIKIIAPRIATDKANNLGVKELIGKGNSLFQHSIQSRIFNINLAAQRINGVLIAPNETFSFDKTLGDVSAFTGYQQAYIIQNGRTVLGDGGGVCQVSTTFFRAILNAGLPIIERYAHAYRVGYYEQDSPPGLDATIYVPSVDLKFKNDTNNHILVQAEINEAAQQLEIYLYGTSDGRIVSMTKPIITNRIPAPPDLYQDDITLPKGIVKQVDFKAEGSKVSFSREVIRDGKKIISENFVSNYAPWRSVFLRGTKE